LHLLAGQIAQATGRDIAERLDLGSRAAQLDHSSGRLFDLGSIRDDLSRRPVHAVLKLVDGRERRAGIDFEAYLKGRRSIGHWLLPRQRARSQRGGRLIRLRLRVRRLERAAG
jgi:hypothetical protein